MPPMPPWSDCAATLIDVATGRAPADTVIRGGRWVNVHSGEIVPGTDVAIARGRFARVGPDASHAIGPDTRLVEADERAELVAAKAQGLVRAMADCGCTLNNAYMQHSLLALVVIPALRISDVGLIDVEAFAETSLFVDAEAAPPAAPAHEVAADEGGGGGAPDAPGTGPA